MLNWQAYGELEFTRFLGWSGVVHNQFKRNQVQMDQHLSMIYELIGVFDRVHPYPAYSKIFENYRSATVTVGEAMLDFNSTYEQRVASADIRMPAIEDYVYGYWGEYGNKEYGIRLGDPAFQGLIKADELKKKMLGRD